MLVFKNINDLKNKLMSAKKIDDINVSEILIEEVNGQELKLMNIGMGVKNGLYEVAYLSENGPEMIRIVFEKDGETINVKEIVDRLNGPRTDS
jgi:uncharacterized protein YpmB